MKYSLTCTWSPGAHGDVYKKGSSMVICEEFVREYLGKSPKHIRITGSRTPFRGSRMVTMKRDRSGRDDVYSLRAVPSKRSGMGEFPGDDAGWDMFSTLAVKITNTFGVTDHMRLYFRIESLDDVQEKE